MRGKVKENIRNAIPEKGLNSNSQINSTLRVVSGLRFPALISGDGSLQFPKYFHPKQYHNHGLFDFANQQSYAHS
jgi:hypothetical protein